MRGLVGRGGRRWDHVLSAVTFCVTFKKILFVAVWGTDCWERGKNRSRDRRGGRDCGLGRGPGDLEPGGGGSGAACSALLEVSA